MREAKIRIDKTTERAISSIRITAIKVVDFFISKSNSKWFNENKKLSIKS